MKEENINIDKFFVDRLAQNQKEEDWNIPSDDIWLSAKTHFAKKQKKKRRFAFWLFGAVLLISILLLFGLKSVKSEGEAKSITSYTIANSPTKKAISKINNVTENPTPTRESIAVVRNSDQMETIEETKSISETHNEDNVSSSLIVSLPTDNPKTVAKTTETTFSKVSNFDKPSGELSSKEISKDKSVMANSNDPAKQEAKSNPIVPNYTAIPSSIQTEAEQNRELTLLEAIPESAVTIESAESKKGIDKILPVAIVPIIPVRYTPKQEIGLSHSKYLFQLFLQDDLISDEEVQIRNFNSSVQNLNVSHRRWYSKNISYAYGAQVSNLAVNFDLDALDTLDQDISALVTDTYEIATRRTSANFDVELLDGFELLKGDIINIKGNIELNLLAVQLPFMIDYHIYRNRMEYLFGTGASIDIMHVTQEASDISIFKHQQMVNKPLMSDRVSEILFDYSLYASFGARYHININWNIGISTKISVLEPIFSYAEFGIYHRWHR